MNIKASKISIVLLLISSLLNKPPYKVAIVMLPLI